MIPTGSIPCTYAGCGEQVVIGSLVVVQPNGMEPTHAVYYYCADHEDLAQGALEVWKMSTR